MKKIIIASLTTLALLAGVVATSAVFSEPAQAINVFSGSCGGSGGGNGGSGGGSGDLCGAASSDSAENLIKNVINILLYLVGIIAIIAIIIGGIRYVTSNGDSGAVKSAKDTVLYAVVGLVVAIMAFAIVNFVVGAF